MKLFTCKVRVMRSVSDEVRRSGATSAEIKILRMIHGGDDAVVDVEPEGEVDRSEAEERARLEMFYGEPAVAKLFGVAKPSIADDIVDAIIPLEPPVRAEPKRPQAAPKALQLEDVA